MRCAPWITTCLMACVTSWAGERSVTICLQPNQRVEATVRYRAEGVATRIYRSIGVELVWKHFCSTAELDAPGTFSDVNLRTIGVEWANQAPASASPDARACARPYQATGNRITLYLDRLAPMLEDRPTGPASLGHVLAHEIGHVLLGFNQHAHEGLMKARWTGVDRGRMLHQVLSFSDDDATAIRRRLDRRDLVFVAAR